MNPKTFVIMFMTILAMYLLAATSQLDRSEFIITQGNTIVVSSTLDTGECDRTKILTEALLRRQYKGDRYQVSCTSEEEEDSK